MCMFKSVKISALKGIYEKGFLSGLYQQRSKYDSLYKIESYRVYRIRISDSFAEKQRIYMG